MKKFLSVILSAILVVTVFPVSSGVTVSAAPTVTTPVFTTEQIQSSQETLVVKFKLVSGSFNSLDIKLEASDGLTCVGIRIAERCDSGGLSSTNSDPNAPCNVSISSVDGVSGEGEVFTVTYNITGRKRNEYSVKFSIRECSITDTSGSQADNVIVNPASPVFKKQRLSIAVTSLPAKTTYCKGYDLDKTGLIVTAYYLDGTSQNITDYSLNYDMSSVGKKQIEVRYTYDDVTATTQFEVTVNEHIPDSGTVTSVVTCTQDGHTVFRCTQCGTVCQEEVIHAQGHNFEIVAVSLPTYNSTGTNEKKCTVCNHVEETITLPKLNPDIDGDGTVNSRDALAILHHVTGIVYLTGDALNNADLNADTEINSMDALIVLQLVTGIIVA